MSSQFPDVVIVGAGLVGAACAYFATRAGLRVTVVDRGSIAGGTSSSGEGNILVSDKEPGPELDLALYSSARWREIGDDLGADRIELEAKGGVIVAREDAAGLAELAAGQRTNGIEAVDLDPARLAEEEPHLRRDLAAGVLYPQDLQVQPMLAAARLLAHARRAGARVRTGLAVTGIDRDRSGRVTGVRTPSGALAAGAVVNAAGPWSAAVADLAGVRLDVQPRRGFVLVTEPLPHVIRHKVYAAEYVANVASDAAGLETSPVIEGTRAGTVLIGSSRERVGFDRSFSLPVLEAMAARAVDLFPFLADVRLLRAYRGFRPYCPDHLPAIGADPRADGLFHACGHEGAGVGLAAGTGQLIAQALTGAEPDLDPRPFRPERLGPAA